MTTDYIVAFQATGNIKFINSVCHNRNRLEIKHPLKDDTFTFIIPPGAGVPGGQPYQSVWIFTQNGTTKTSAKDLFNNNNSAYVPFGRMLSVVHDGELLPAKTFSFEPSTTAPGTTFSTDRDVTAPPDTGTIKVGG